MKRVLSQTQLVFYGIGMIVGSGIYSVIGKAAGIAEGSLWLSFIIAAATALLTALSYAELSSMFTKAGAEYIYVKNIFPLKEILAFFCGAMMIFAGVSTSATVAHAFSGYLQQFFEAPTLIVAFVVLVVFTLINLWGIKEASWVNIIFTLIELLGLVIIIYFGFDSSSVEKSISTFQLSENVWKASALVIFSYFGFETVVNFADETEQPEKKLPRAILLSLLVAAVLYFFVSIATMNLAKPEVLAASKHPISAIVQNQSALAATVLGLIALFSTANTVLISMLSTSRIIFSMGREGDLPKLFATETKKHTPKIGAILVLILSSVLIPAGGVEVLASTSAFATMLVFAIINISLIYLRYKKPDEKRPFKVPLNIARFPLLPVAATVSSIALLFFFESKVYFLAFAVIALTLIFYFFIRDRLMNL
ncbi:APC family permease [Bdellovibrio reynosensis]|uniref:APC family permease n=1 Tax=Bdellovibrio reynosensis TaxID=2835041 RepID=A0ABY4C433_9BACT|nr:APC family permease [Bdellovibrio reynosensis]UOE99719.1 APC family permease [Bdellovibrio reynosensis]